MGRAAAAAGSGYCWPISRRAMACRCNRGSTVARLAPGTPALGVIAVQAQFLVEDVLEGEARALMFAPHVGLHLLALFVLLERANRQPDAPLLGIELHHQRLDLIADL